MPAKFSVATLAAAAIGLAAVAGAGYWWSLRPSPAAAGGRCPRAEAGEDRDPGPGEGGGAAGSAPVRSFPGRVQAGRGRRVDVSFRVPGTLLEVPVKTNQSVAKGQVLARLDPRDFETRLAQSSSAVAEARARLAAMQAGDRPEDIQILESQLAAEQARLREAELDFTRTRNLFDRGAATKDAFERATRAVEVARANTAAATTALARARAGARVEDIEAQRALIGRLDAQQRETRDALEDTRLTAPFAGGGGPDHGRELPGGSGTAAHPEPPRRVRPRDRNRRPRGDHGPARHREREEHDGGVRLPSRPDLSRHLRRVGRQKPTPGRGPSPSSSPCRVCLRMSGSSRA